MINKKRLINTFKTLVQIDSISLKEGQMMAYLIKELKKLGYKPYFTAKPEGGEVGNLMVDVPGQGPVVMLNAHVDTVGHSRKIKPVEKNGYIVSGSNTILGSDNKAGVAAILEILKTIKEKRLAHPAMQIVFTVAEEIGLVGARVIPKNKLKAKFGIALDGGDINEIVNQAPSQINLKAVIIGKAAHAGIHPEDGINAIQTASEAIAKMKLGRIDKETTANIGIIKGGRARNIIPDKVSLEGEARSHNPKKLARQIKHMARSIEKKCKAKNAKCKIKTQKIYTSFEVKENHSLIQAAKGALKSTGIKPMIKSTGGGSDANIFNAIGIPTIIMGVGADHVHTAKERLPINDFVKGTEIVLELLKILTPVYAMFPPPLHFQWRGGSRIVLPCAPSPSKMEKGRRA